MAKTYPFAFLPARLDRMAKKGIPTSANMLMRGVSTAIGAAVVDATRVDTGAARSNWRAALNVPERGTIEPYAPGRKLGRGETANAAAAKNQQRLVIRLFNSKRDKSIFITNFIDYIEKLNNGSPTNSPDAMVEKGIQAGRNAFATIKFVNRL